MEATTPRPNACTLEATTGTTGHDIDRASNHGHDTESRQLPRKCYRGTRPTLATSNGLSPSSEPMTTEATTGHDIDTERASKGMNRGNDIDRAATSRALLFPSSEPMTTEATTGRH